MNTEKINHKSYVKPAIQEIQIAEDVQLLHVSNYDGAETDWVIW